MAGVPLQAGRLIEVNTMAFAAEHKGPQNQDAR
jgi:hypothetical protein